MSASKKYTDSDLKLFFLGPLYLILIRLNGTYSHHNTDIKRSSDNKMGRKLTLMSLGTIFYVILIIVMINYD